MKSKLIKSIIISPFIGLTALVLSFAVIQNVAGQQTYIEEFTFFQEHYYSTIMNYTLHTLLTILGTQLFLYYLKKMFENFIKKITIIKCILFEIYFIVAPLSFLPIANIIKKLFPVSKNLSMVFFLTFFAILLVYSLIWCIKISIEEKQLKKINKIIQEKNKE